MGPTWSPMTGRYGGPCLPVISPTRASLVTRCSRCSWLAWTPRQLKTNFRKCSRSTETSGGSGWFGTSLRASPKATLSSSTRRSGPWVGLAGTLTSWWWTNTKCSWTSSRRGPSGVGCHGVSVAGWAAKRSPDSCVSAAGTDPSVNR